MADKAIVDKAISDLTQALQITNEDLFVLEQSGEAKKLKGSQVVQYAKDSVAAEVQGVKEYADSAKASADAAAASAEKAAGAAQGIDDKVAAADTSAKAAASSAAAAAASATGVDEKVQAAQTAATNAAKSETAAKDAQTAAANAQKVAESAQTGAQTAKTAAESAQKAAESAKDAAAGSSTAAGQKATQAAQSAEDAASAKSAAETAKTDAQAARDAIVNMIVEAVTLETGKPATVSKSLVDNVYKLVFGLPRGGTGAPGPKGATGNGISGIALKSGNHAPGTSDVYTITLTDGTTFDFEVYNGANGQGAGDMLASVYDPQGKRTDIYKYVDDAIGKIPTPDVSGKLDKTGDGSNVTAAFTAATTRSNIATGEKLSVLFGKIAKWFADLGTLAFKSTVAKSDLASDVQASLGKADSALQSAPVTSVNSKTGAVSLAKGDVGLGNVDNVKQYSKNNPPPYPVTSVNGKTGAVTVSVPTVPSTTNILKGNGSGGIVAATRGSDYATPPVARKVTLTVAGWNSSTKQQTVTCTGVLADVTKQDIHPRPVDTSYDNAWKTYGIKCIKQAANSLTFQCNKIPTSAVDIYVTITNLNFLS
jgi:hypothetical protein|nr:MAG TPA: hypothetical protein [Caudoviricetes sp.]